MASLTHLMTTEVTEVTQPKTAHYLEEQHKLVLMTGGRVLRERRDTNKAT